MNYDVLKEYTDALSPSGCEGNIRDVIKSKVQNFGDIVVDSMGNLMVHKKGSGKRVMIAAHMDEVGFIVTSICKDGRIKFGTVGGIDPRILVSKRVIFAKNNLLGVIGVKPIHLQDREERGKPIPKKDLFIDIGATSKEEAEKYVKLGDFAAFESEYIDLGETIKAKALDDRIGCFLLTKLLKDDYDFDLYGAFTAQEEVGSRGAGVAAYRIKPDVAIAIEGTTCADIAKDEKDFVTTLGDGPAISLMDRTSSASGKLLKMIINTAEENKIPYQFRRGIVGGNDAGRISRAREGCLTCTISVPTRYIHSPISMIKKKDFENTLKLIKLVLKNIEKGEF